MKLDDDIKSMSHARRGYELQRARNFLRSHKRKEGNARCWMNDVNLYDNLLPEGSEGVGLMDLPEEVVLKNCRRYYRRQNCQVRCSHKPRGQNADS